MNGIEGGVELVTMSEKLISPHHNLFIYPSPIYLSVTMSKVKLICGYCGKEFETYLNAYKKRYCSRECYSTAQRTRITQVCEVCGKELRVKPSKIKLGQGKYCSWECYSEKRIPRLRECEYCGQLFEIKYDARKFCSRECWNKSLGALKDKECPTCKKTFHQTSNHQIYCSRGCVPPRKGEKHPIFGKHRSEETRKKISKSHTGIVIPHTHEQDKKIREAAIRMWQNPKFREKIIKALPRGENHPQWKGGISFEPYCSKFNEALKEEIRDKFGRVCFLCPKTEEENGQKLSVHHTDYNKEQGCNGIRWLLVPLCRSCNAQVNHNRDYWWNFITEKMRREGYLN